MGVLSNAKHEKFAQELAKGATADEAYQLAGYAENRGNAIRLKANERIAARVSELLERSAKRTEVTVAGITTKLLAIAEKAEVSPDAPLLAVARAAYMDAARLNGLVIEKAQLDATIKDERELSDAELVHIARTGSDRTSEATGRPN